MHQMHLNQKNQCGLFWSASCPMGGGWRGAFLPHPREPPLTLCVGWFTQACRPCYDET